MILFRRTDSAGQSGGSGARGDAGSVIGEIADGDAGESLVDMHAEVLLTIATEAYGVVVAEYLFNAIDESTVGHLQLAQNAVAANHQLRLTDYRLHLGKRLLQIPHKIHTARPPQDKTLLDSAEQSQATVGADLLNRAHIVRTIDQDPHRLLRKAHGVEAMHVRSNESSIPLGGRQAVDLPDDPMFGIRRRDHDPLVRENKMLGLEYPEQHERGDQGPDSAIRMEAAVGIHLGSSKI